MPTKGDQENSLTFLAVGRAISQWEYFEGYLGLVYGGLVGNVLDTSPVMRAYGTVSAFSGRLEMVLEAAKAFYFSKDPKNGKALKDFLDEAKHFSTRRNEIAHGIVQPYYAGGLAFSGYALGPSRHATRKLKLGKRHTNEDAVFNMYAYTSVELEYFRKEFDRLARTAMSFYNLVETDKRPKELPPG